MRIVSTIALWGLLFVAMPVSAATLYMQPNQIELKRSDSATVSVRIDVDEEAGECINAVDGVITYDAGVQPVDVSIGQSIFPMWVEAPVIDADARTITFAGGIPNGYCGRIDGDPRLTNVIAELVFSSPGFSIRQPDEEVSDTASISFTPETQVYLNDGRGSRAPLRTLGATVRLLDERGGTDNEWLDRVDSDEAPPEAFSIELVEGGKESGGKFYIVFNTTDKQTGVDHYKVLEEPLGKANLFNFGAANAPWVRARSPYILKDQTLNSRIYVKAIDNAGNEYVATLEPDASLRTKSYNQYVVFALGGIFLLILLISPVFLMVSRRRKRRAAHTEERNVDDEGLLEVEDEHDAEEDEETFNQSS